MNGVMFPTITTIEDFVHMCYYLNAYKGDFATRTIWYVRGESFDLLSELC